MIYFVNSQSIHNGKLTLKGTTLMRVIRWTLFRALFQPEFRHFRSFFSMDDLVRSIIFNLSDFEASWLPHKAHNA